jgi:nitrogen-specific signal transduction histidine kinase
MKQIIYERNDRMNNIIKRLYLLKDIASFVNKIICIHPVMHIRLIGSS